MNNLKQNFSFIIVLMNCDEKFEISKKYDNCFPQTNNMYWMNQQEHMVLYFLARADNGRSVTDNIARIFNRGALFWMAEALQSKGRYEKGVNIESIKSKTNKKYNNWRTRVNDIHSNLNFMENMKPFYDECCLSVDKTELLLKYIIHYLSILGNSRSINDKKIISNIIKNFEMGYGRYFNKIDDNILENLLEENTKYIACNKELSNEICVFKNKLLKRN